MCRDTQIALEPDRRATPDAQIGPQDLWFYQYINLTIKLDVPDNRITFGVNVA